MARPRLQIVGRALARAIEEEEMEGGRHETRNKQGNRDRQAGDREGVRKASAVAITAAAATATASILVLDYNATATAAAAD